MNQEVTHAEGEAREVEISFADTLKEGEMQSLKVGEKDGEKVLIARY